jgi:hypothetical protein
VILDKNFKKTLQQGEFEKKHNEVYELYNHIQEFDLSFLTPGKDNKSFVSDKFAF